MNLPFPSHAFDEAVAAACHGTATEEQLRALNLLLRADPAARDAYLFEVELHARLASQPELFATAPAAGTTASFPSLPSLPARRTLISGRAQRTFAMAAGILLLLSLGWAWRHFLSPNRPGATSRAVAMLNRSVNARWSPADRPPRLGAALEPGRLRLDSGLAQIVFYNGARVALEGPAEIELLSSSEASFLRGRLTAEVPPQARGFRVVAPRLDVTDLGTAFGMNVIGGRTELHVFEGQVDFRTDRNADRRDLAAGNAAIADGSTTPRLVPADRTGFTPLFELQARSQAADAQRYRQWREASARLQNDPALWVHFDFDQATPTDWRLPNVGTLKPSVPDATIVGCQWLVGRWSSKPGLEFRGVSDRVRLSVPGTVPSLTLAAWVRIQGLDRQINSLFMSDGFAEGTVHWVIRHDGVMGLTLIGAGGRHEILASPALLTPDQFGIWTHLAVVLDGATGQAVHYLNGEPVSQHAVRIPPPYRIGTAEIGNWNAVGFRGNDPFLIRNFSGVIDEFALFSRALTPAGIQALYADGKPQSD